MGPIDPHERCAFLVGGDHAAFGVAELDCRIVGLPKLICCWERLAGSHRRPLLASMVRISSRSTECRCRSSSIPLVGKGSRAPPMLPRPACGRCGLPASQIGVQVVALRCGNHGFQSIPQGVARRDLVERLHIGAEQCLAVRSRVCSALRRLVEDAAQAIKGGPQGIASVQRQTSPQLAPR